VKKIIEGWLGGQWDDFGIYETKIDAKRGIYPKHEMFELMEDFDSKRVRIIVEEIEG